MAQYKLTPKQKAEIRKEGHTFIERNGKTIRVTPSMVKTRSKKKSKAKRR